MPPVRFLLIFLLLLAAPLRAFECSGKDLLSEMPLEQRLRLEARAGIAPYGEGLLWRATRGDTDLTIFGTFHTPHDGTQAQFDALLPRAMTADFSYFEMDHEDQTAFEKRAATDASIMFITQGPTLPDLLDDSDWQRLRAQMAERGMPSFMVAKFKPIFVSMMLGMSPCQMKLQKSGAKGIDARLSLALSKAGRETRSIEDSLTTMHILDAFDQAEQVAMIKLSLNLPLKPDDLQETMMRLYGKGRIAMLWEYARAMSIAYGGPTAKADFDKFEDVLLTRRNLNWVDEIEANATGHSVFIAVGAGHLPGKIGLLNLLAEQGYDIERLSLE